MFACRCRQRARPLPPIRLESMSRRTPPSWRPDPSPRSPLLKLDECLGGISVACVHEWALGVTEEQD
jgi:hypothetical protein